MKIHGAWYIILGFLLVVFGAVAPFFIVIDIIYNYFWLNLLAYCASVLGICLGVFGAIEFRKDELD
jgi:hypothetical protein